MFDNFINSIIENGYDKDFQFAFITLSIAFIIKLTEFLVQKRFERAAEKSENDFDDFLINLCSGFNFIFDLSFALLVSSLLVQVNEKFNFYLTRVTFLITLFFLIKALINIINYGFKKAIISRKKDEEYDPTMLKVARSISGGIIWIIAIIFVLHNFGFNVSTIVGGLGIAGIAVAFGLQSILQDIFAFFSIYLDKPYKVGDFIVIGKDMGTVKKIGIKSTRLRTLQGQDLILSNKEMTQSRINNYHGMKGRRVVLNFGVDYKTPSEKLEKIPKEIAKIIGRIENAEFTRAHFKSFGEWAYIFEVVYKMDDSDYMLFMDFKQEINLKILKYLEQENIELASKIGYNQGNK